MKPSPCKRSLTAGLPPWLSRLLLLLIALLVSHAASAAQDPWPREIKAKEGKAVIYQP
jgi:ABC-type Fe2+-enterobactin transport system substrate-binding protein